INNLGLTGSAITDFDGDGANSGGTSCITTNLGGPLYGCNGATNSEDASHGNTGYAGFDTLGSLNANRANPGDMPGPDNYFTAYTNPGNSATINFDGGLNAGDSAWFSLEEPATAGGLGVTANVPEPSSIVLLGSLILGAAGILRRRLSS
ncbi:MAG: PEP-CTERM sorting domain-containing protein, partial [Bryobacteraceae bacterium]